MHFSLLAAVIPVALAASTGGGGNAQVFFPFPTVGGLDATSVGSSDGTTTYIAQCPASSASGCSLAGPYTLEQASDSAKNTVQLKGYTQVQDCSVGKSTAVCTIKNSGDLVANASKSEVYTLVDARLSAGFVTATLSNDLKITTMDLSSYTKSGANPTLVAQLSSMANAGPEETGANSTGSSSGAQGLTPPSATSAYAIAGAAVAAFAYVLF
uniref:ARAD1B23925p n=1 Tax=Blastobotrys adeninivorans TaxID=409370 RepID=A0A060T705_BLAAD